MPTPQPKYAGINGPGTGSLIPQDNPTPTPVVPSPAPAAAPTPARVMHNPDGSIYTPGPSTVAPTGKDVFGNAVNVPVSASTPTIASVYGNGISQADKNINGFADSSLAVATAPVDEVAIRDRVQKQLQAETDALNKIYDNKLQEARLGGENALGSNAAISARRGLLGSDFGTAQDQKVRDQNSSVYAGIDNERAAAIASLTTKGAAIVQSELANKNALKQQSTQDYITFLGKQEERRSERVKQAIAHIFESNTDLSTVSREELKSIADSYQISPDALAKEFADQKASNEKLKQDQEAKAATEKRLQQTADAQALKDRYITLSDGVTLYDTQTGATVAKNPKDFAPAKSAGAKGLPQAAQSAKDTASRIVAGQGTIDELSPAQAVSVRNELYRMGYGQNTKVPAWFEQIINEKVGTYADPQYIKDEWAKENATIFKTTPKATKSAAKSTTSSAPSGTATVDDL